MSVFACCSKSISVGTSTAAGAALPALPLPVIAALRQFETLLLFGPGEAKGELHKRLVKMKLGARVSAVETQDKMTDAQIAAKVRAHFGLGTSPGQRGN